MVQDHKVKRRRVTIAQRKYIRLLENGCKLYDISPWLEVFDVINNGHGDELDILLFLGEK